MTKRIKLARINANPRRVTMAHILDRQTAQRYDLTPAQFRIYVGTRGGKHVVCDGRSWGAINALHVCGLVHYAAKLIVFSPNHDGTGAGEITVWRCK